MNQEQAVALVCENPLLNQVVEAEPFVFWHIVDDAIHHPEGTSRWKCYERLKKQAATIVGWHATNSVLATSRHYEAVINLIDELLPPVSENDVPDTEEIETVGDRSTSRPQFVHIGTVVDEIVEELKQYRRERGLDAS